MTCIFMAGAEVETLTRSLLDNGVKHILYSFFYINQMSRENFIARMQEEYKDVQWLLDSGAFTYYTKFQQEPDKLMPYKKYIRKYMQYLGEYGAPYCRVAEPDLDNTFPDITIDVVDEWRERLLSDFPHLPIMPTWHWWRGSQDWTLYCKDPRIHHMAIGRSPGGPGNIRRLIQEAHRHGKTVHGFGMTRINTDLKMHPFDTVDSTSWLMGQKYGTMFLFMDGIFKALPTTAGKDKRRLYMNHFKRIGCDWRKIMADDVAEVRKANVIAWRDLSNRLQVMRKIRPDLVDCVIREHYGRQYNEEKG